MRPVSPGSLLADARANLRRLEDARQPALGDARGLGHFARPAAVRHVEQQRAGGFLHVDGELAGEAVADVVLGTHDVGDLREDLRLVLLDPQEFGQREVGQRGIAGEFDEALVANAFGEPVALGLGARVAPDERRAQDRAVFVEHDRAVHLAGEGDGGNGLPGLRRCGQCTANGLLRGAPPVFGVLLGPSWMLGAKGRMCTGCRAHQLACRIHYNGARAARSHIHSKEPHSSYSPYINRFSPAERA